MHGLLQTKNSIVVPKQRDSTTPLGILLESLSSEAATQPKQPLNLMLPCKKNTSSSNSSLYKSNESMTSFTDANGPSRLALALKHQASSGNANNAASAFTPVFKG